MKKGNLQIIFKTVKNLFRIYKRNHCKIDNITKINTEYIVSFIYVSKRQIFKKPVYEIFINPYLLNELSPFDAALIGFYNSISEHEKGFKK